MEVTRILKIRYHPSLKWSTRNRKTGYFSLLKQRIKRYLISLSGNDLPSMLCDILNKNELAELQNKYSQALENISIAINNTSIVKPKSKHHFIRPLREAGLSLAQVKDFGIKCSKDLWKSCLDINERNLGGKKSLTSDMIIEIKEHMENFSNVGANRTVKLKFFAERNPHILYKKQKINESIESVRYRQTSFKAAFTEFKNRNNNNQDGETINKIHFSSFYKYIDNRFKKPFRCTDLCHYCEFGKDIEREIKLFLQRFPDYTKEFDCENLLEFLNRKLNNNIDSCIKNDISLNIDKIMDLKSIYYHKSIAKRQRNTYNNFRLDPFLLDGKILIDVDYKQKIILGQGPRVLNAEFFEANKKKVVCLGFGVYYVERRDNYQFVNCLNIDVISDYDGQNASDLIKVFKYVMDMPAFREIEQNNYIIWSDCGKQFRCAEFMYFLFNDLAEKGKSVNVNFFAEKHGKNMRDQHFSVVTRAIQKSTFQNQNRVRSATEVVDILNSSSIYLNEEKLSKNQTVSSSIATYFNPENEIVQRNKRIIQDLNCYYNFQNILNILTNQFELFSTVFSDCNSLTPIDSVIETNNEKFRNLQNRNENQILETLHKDRRQTIENNITNKRIRINYISQLSKTKGYELNLGDRSFENFRTTSTEQSIEQTVDQQPLFCINNCKACASPTNYSISDIKKNNFISQAKLNDELFLHRHKKNLIMPKSKKTRNVQEAKAELLAHYKYAHNFS